MHGYKQTLFLQKYLVTNLIKLATLKSIEQKKAQTGYGLGPFFILK